MSVATPQSPQETKPAKPAKARHLEYGSGGGSVGALIVKILVLCVVGALGVYGTWALWAYGAPWPAALMAVATLAIIWVYLSRRALPAKYLAPGIAFLLVYQVFTVLYTGLTAFTNYGDGHNSDKQDAIAAILTKTENRIPDSPAFPLTVVQSGETIGFLVTDPRDGAALFGTEQQFLAPADNVTFDADGKAVGIRGWRTLSYPEVLAKGAEIVKIRVPYSAEASDGSIRTPDGSRGFQYISTFQYDPDADTMTDTSTGTVYTSQATGNFVSADGTTLEPGWRVFVGLSNFTSLLTNGAIRGPFIGVFVWTFVFALGSTVLCFALGLLLALALNEQRMRFRKTYRSLLLIPYAFPAFMSALVWAGMLNEDFGFINQVLLGGASIPWLTDPWLARFSVLMVNMWLGFPYMFLVCTGALQSIPADVTEAAKMDGATGFKTFRFVKFPLLLVSLAPLLISTFAFNFNNFNLIYMLTGGGPRDLDAAVDVGATDILISFTYKIAFGGVNRQYGLACAVSVLIFVVVATVSAISFRRTRTLEELN